MFPILPRRFVGFFALVCLAVLPGLGACSSDGVDARDAEGDAYSPEDGGAEASTDGAAEASADGAAEANADAGGGAFEIATGDSVTVTLDADGGEIVVPSAQGAITITVPPLALLEATELTATPIASYSLVGFARGVHFAPEGLAFHAPLILRMPRADFAFGYHGQGEGTYLMPFRVEGSEMLVDVWHFSGVGGGDGALPGTVPTDDDAAALDAAARGELAALEAALASAWATIDPLLTNAGASRAAFDAAATSYASWAAKVALAALEQKFSVELQSGETRIQAALIEERDRILAAAVASNDWTILVDLVAWVLPRAQVRGLADDGGLSVQGMRALVPMTATIEEVALVYGASDQRYHLVGKSSVRFNNGPPILDPPMSVEATINGTVAVTYVQETVSGQFEIIGTQNRATLHANVIASFPRLPLDITASTSLTVQNTAPLSVGVDADPSVMTTQTGSNITATVQRGAGPLGLAGQVTFFVDAGSFCQLGATQGIPDENGEVKTTLTCNRDISAQVYAYASHNADTAEASTNVSVTLDCTGVPTDTSAPCVIPDGSNASCACYSNACESMGLCMGCGQNGNVIECECYTFGAC